MGFDSIRAVAQIYGALGLETPTDSGAVIFRYSDFVHMNSKAGTFVNVASVAQILDDKHPIAEVRVESKYISSRITVDQKAQLAVGDQLTAVSEKRRGKVQIAEIGPFVESTQPGTPAGHDVRIALPADLGDLEPGEPVALSKMSESGASLAVPVLGIRTENGGGYVLGLAGLSGGLTMYLSVLSRLPGIALRRAMGSSRPAIMGTFLLEGAMVGLAGGLTGLAIGPGLLILVCHAQGWIPSLDALTMLTGLSSGVAAGLVSSAVPAYVASRAAPAELIRS
jgi:hypothetical protein